VVTISVSISVFNFCASWSRTRNFDATKHVSHSTITTFNVVVILNHIKNKPPIEMKNENMKISNVHINIADACLEHVRQITVMQSQTILTVDAKTDG